MKGNFSTLYEELRGRLFLSSMMSITDSNFCFERSEGCGMVQLGAYLAEPPAYREEDYFLPSTPEECTGFFRDDLQKLVGLPGVSTCLNLATPRLEWGLDAAECFHRAGGDLLELNVHGNYQPYIRLGKLRAMVLPENRDELFGWIEAFSRLDIPLIVKFRKGVIMDYSPVLDEIEDLNVFGVHFNVRDDETKKPDFDFVREAKRDSLFLLVSGYVRSVEDAERLFEAGADMVGIAEPTLKDAMYIDNIAKNLF